MRQAALKPRDDFDFEGQLINAQEREAVSGKGKPPTNGVNNT